MAELRAMSIMAHPDDFEFMAGGLFALLRKLRGPEAVLKILTTTRGASGHHEMGLEETARRRDLEARASAAVLDAEYECLRGLDGTHPMAQFLPDANLLGGLWNAIRAFGPDVIFCPPFVSDPLAGVHIDHYNTAWAVRMLAYQLTVPHAYPTVSGPVRMRVPYPAIVNVEDVYACTDSHDLAVDISPVYEEKVRMSLCHESQVFEWLPWNLALCGADAPANPRDVEEFKRRFRKRHTAVNTRYGQDDAVPREFFCLTQWGRKATREELRTLLFADAKS
jgi:LmbE family N-acetylglucosaminyl deacetylase